MLLCVIPHLWNIIGDSSFVVSSILPSVVAFLSFHMPTGKLGSRPVQTLDTKSKRRLYEVLHSQDIQMNQEITFLSDGDDTLRALQWEMSPKATHRAGCEFSGVPTPLPLAIVEAKSGSRV